MSGEIKEIEIKIGSGKGSLSHQRFLKAKGLSEVVATEALTKTELMQTREEIERRLRGFVEVNPEEVDALPKNAFVSYITFDVQKNKELYRPGGFLRKVHADYVVLMGKGSAIFSVQRKVWQDPKTKEALVYMTRFFKRVPKGEGVEAGAEGTRMVGGGAGERDELMLEEAEEKNMLLRKQQEILAEKEREIEEMRKRLEALEARNPHLRSIAKIDEQVSLPDDLE
jgi:hypothetical protein